MVVFFFLKTKKYDWLTSPMEIARRNVTDEKLTYRHIHDDKESDEDGQRNKRQSKQVFA